MQQLRSARQHARCFAPVFRMLVGTFLVTIATSPASAEVSTSSHAAAYPALNTAAHWIATGFEVAGVSSILLVALGASARFARALIVTPNWLAAIPDFRADMGRGVLLGLELLVAADIVGTVAIAPTFDSLGVLAIVILIRTFLSISLGVEIEGHWPWRRREIEKQVGSSPPA